MVFPRGIPVSPWRKPGETTGENQPERKSKVGACLFGIAKPGEPLGFPRGKVAFLPFPFGFPRGKGKGFLLYVNSGILDFDRPGFWVG